MIKYYSVFAALLFSVNASAVPNLSQAPLFSTHSVPPNIFFEIDDSGSMLWNLLANNHYKYCDYNSDSSSFGGNFDCILNSGGTPIDEVQNGYMIIGNAIYSDYSTAILGSSCSASTVCNNPRTFDWRFWSSDLNVTYYDVNETYTPWASSGLPDSSFSSARQDPVPGKAGYNSTVNLDTFVYAKWIDSHGYSGSRPHRGSNENRNNTPNGRVDLWDRFTLYVTRTNEVDAYDMGYRLTTSGAMQLQILLSSGTWRDISSAEYNDIIKGSRSLINASRRFTGTAAHAELNNRTVAQAKTNIANWYSFSRNRVSVTKSAVASVVTDNPSFRYGLSVINHPENLLVEHPDGLTGFLAHNKSMLDSLNSYEFPNRGTPLRQGLQYAGEYYAGNKTTNDPIDYTCQQNFTILMTDGHWNGAAPTGIADEDGDGHSQTLADVAKYYYDTDLSPMADNVPTSNKDGNSIQHMDTFTVAFGVNGLLSDDDNTGWPGVGDPLIESSDWGNPLISSNRAQKIDDLWHAAYNSKGEFSNASNPTALLGALNGAVSNIAARIGSAATVAFNTATLTGNSYVYLAQFSYFNNKWSGDLSAYYLDASTGDVSPTASWQAATLLDNKNWITRQIITSNNGVGVPFSWPAISTEMKADLTTNPIGGTDVAAEGAKRLNFIRGDRSNEGSSYRTRDHVLGDVVHSSPIFVGKPLLNWTDLFPFPSTSGNTYSDFKIAQAARQEMVYVGTNDGMLHGFKGDTGEELFSFIPDSLASPAFNKGLHYLTDKDYSHRFYTDLTPAISDVYIDLTGTKKWRSVLVGGLRSGGKGLFALDVTDPTAVTEANAASSFLWEFSDKDEPNMGFSHSIASIGLMNNGRWAAIVGNGYNNTGDGKAKLFILFLDGGIDGVWTKGVDYIELDTNSGSIVSSNCQDTSSQCNGLSTPQAVDLDQDMIVDRVYAGDLNGNMWAFNVESSNTSLWGSHYGTALAPAPLFTHPGHAITSKPTVALNTGSGSAASNSPNLIVLFGTGRYLYKGDANTSVEESFFGIWDHGVSNITPSSLVQQTFIKDAGLPDYSLVTNKDVNYVVPTTDNGWQIALTEFSGERIIVNPVVRDNIVFFNTWIPDSDPCSAGGSGYLMTVSVLNGGSPDPDPAFDINGDGVVDGLDVITYVDPVTGETVTSAPSGERYTQGLPASSGFITRFQYTPGTRGGSGIHKRTITEEVSHNKERIAWQEIINQ